MMIIRYTGQYIKNRIVLQLITMKKYQALLHIDAIFLIKLKGDSMYHEIILFYFWINLMKNSLNMEESHIYYDMIY